MLPKILLLSNGHGEDAIAVTIGQAWSELAKMEPREILVGLPLVGEGNNYRRLNIPLIGPVKTMPSGGFNNMDAKELWRDMRGGLWGLTKAQLDNLKQWTAQGGKVLAVGDIVPLALAWLGRAEYAFVGTAKSEYYLRSPVGEWLTTTKSWEKWLGSAYYPWERWLMARKNCVAVFPRDRPTHNKLLSQGIASYPVGNPMMDGLNQEDYQPQPLQPGQGLTITLLPGSRSPEMERNWALIVESLTSVLTHFPDSPITFLAAIAPSLPLKPLMAAVENQGWHRVADNSPEVLANNIAAIIKGTIFRKDQGQLIFSQQQFVDCLHHSQGAIAMAGTATEQFVGLGKPVISFPGDGPQYTPYFARRQTWLLGESLILLDSPDQAGAALHQVLHNIDRLKAIARNGRERLGETGAARLIAEVLHQKWC
ncbi:MULTISPECIES: lipid-A-disaccharide synthase-related protein [unclassified Synechocystis]|uniref:lipid-A-disaccharide synthase-related protein n=1 Tax=unclassified Synechocystis TaxID=2640012 RepID=UPI0004173BCB|nr:MULTISPECIES: lipid-A-disaccharide synthase-related protein [unclassified Synechocystis]AIE72892.1 hypothetical protein D082_03630 [Synechocystis sp. PCC 6714]MCT0252624.1 lipid-A-disaccharide synthase-related protein [Synechocystis sp. CS-94]